MKIISTGYSYTAAFADPEEWLKRISFHTGILEALAKKHEVISTEQISYSGELLQNGVHYHFIDPRNYHFYFPWKLHRYIKKQHPDIILVNGFVFPWQLIQLRHALGKKIKIAVINHAEKPSAGLRKLLQRVADRYVQWHFFTSREAGAEWVKNGIIARQDKIVEAMEASSFFKPMEKEEAVVHTQVTGSPVFLFVGRLDANKDPLTVLKAFASHVTQQPGARLYMIYHTEELLGDIQAYLEKDIDLSCAVKLVGRVAHPEMEYWYNSADFIISASHYEGSGVAVCEAMGCSCIPILTNIPSFRMMTAKGNCGFLYEPGDADALSAILLQTVKLDKEEEKKKVLQQFRQTLSFKAIAAKMEETFGLPDIK